VPDDLEHMTNHQPEGTDAMPAARTRTARILIAALAITAATAAAAPANTRFANIHTPHLLGADSEFADPVAAEFGGTFDVYIGNSDDNTVVRACISNHCRRLFQDGDNWYRYTASAFDLTFKSGQKRTVEVWAANGNSRQHWGPTKLTIA
jgi:hypothetical protein